MPRTLALAPGTLPCECDFLPSDQRSWQLSEALRNHFECEPSKNVLLYLVHMAHCTRVDPSISRAFAACGPWTSNTLRALLVDQITQTLAEPDRAGIRDLLHQVEMFDATQGPKNLVQIVAGVSHAPLADALVTLSEFFLHYPVRFLCSSDAEVFSFVVFDASGVAFPFSTRIRMRVLSAYGFTIFANSPQRDNKSAELATESRTAEADRLRFTTIANEAYDLSLPYSFLRQYPDLQTYEPWGTFAAANSSTRETKQLDELSALISVARRAHVHLHALLAPHSLSHLYPTDTFAGFTLEVLLQLWRTNTTFTVASPLSDEEASSLLPEMPPELIRIIANYVPLNILVSKVIP